MGTIVKGSNVGSSVGDEVGVPAGMAEGIPVVGEEVSEFVRPVCKTKPGN